MNKIVHAHFPVDELPERLRHQIGPGGLATITVEPEPESWTGRDAEKPPGQGHFGRFRHLRRSNFASADEVNAHLAALRD